MTSDPAAASAELRRSQDRSRQARRQDRRQRPRPGPSTSRNPLIRPIVTWTIVAAFLVGAAISSVGAVNENIYGAGNFVHEYLDALADHDAQAALTLPGVDVTSGHDRSSALPADASRILLRNSLAGDIRNISIARDEPIASDTSPGSEGESGTRTVTVDYLLDSKPQRSTFTVEPAEPRFGIFQSWRFAESPLSAISLTVKHETIFDVNGLKLDIRSTEPDQADPFVGQASYLVFTPGSYTFSHTSRLLTAESATAIVTKPRSTTKVDIDAEANSEFISSVQTELNSYLDDCASQQVLMPSGCPFGQFIENRLQGLPTWAITKYPSVTLTPTDTGWEMPEKSGTAQLTGEVQSLFDGSISDLDDDVPFTVALSVSIRPDGSLDIRVQ